MLNGAFFAGHYGGRSLPEDVSVLSGHRLIIPTSFDMTTPCPPGTDMDAFFSGHSEQRGPMRIRYHDAADCCLALVDISRLRELDNRTGRVIPAWLSKEEQEYIGRFRFPKRHFEWLSGRIAAKAALLRGGNYLEGDYQPDEITILADEHGRPMLLRPRCVRMPQLSISHSGCCGVAMVSLQDCGVDIQQIESRIANLGDHIGTEQEIQLAAEQVSGSLEEGLTLLWTVKEAVKKCCLHDRPGLFTATVVNRIFCKRPGQWIVDCRLSGKGQEVRVALLGGYMLAWCRRDDNA